VTWILLDLAIALSALGLLAVMVLGLWRRVKALSATVSAAGETVAQATDALAAAQSARGSTSAPAAPPSGVSAAPAVHRPDAGRPPTRGVQDRAAGRSLTSSPRRGARP
jgi:hypothetical protein